MHCDTSEEPSASWRESWHALERAYAEGHISSIGVSNFDSRLLAEFDHFGTVLPHAVQNAARTGQVDLPAREWCSLHDAVFMPYSTQANFKTQPKEVVAMVKNAALNHAVSPHAIISRFFHQSGMFFYIILL
jgi:diketogulonate reductase-like aldo/keto reductase